MKMLEPLVVFFVAAKTSACSTGRARTICIGMGHPASRRKGASNCSRGPGAGSYGLLAA